MVGQVGAKEIGIERLNEGLKEKKNKQGEIGAEKYRINMYT